MLLLTTAQNNITVDFKFIVIVLIVLIAVLIVSSVFKSLKKKKISKALSDLCSGDKIVLCNGMTGTFLSKSEGTVEIELSSGARARFMEWAVLEINGVKL